MESIQLQGCSARIDDRLAVGEAFISGRNTDAAAKPAYGVVKSVLEVVTRPGQTVLHKAFAHTLETWYKNKLDSIIGHPKREKRFIWGAL